MSETVLQSLITAGAGFFGALVGAVAAIIGPWWLRRSDRVATTKSERLEKRRAAIVEYIDAQVAMSNHVVPGDPETGRRSLRANRSLADLSSQLGEGEKPIDDWMHGLSSVYSRASVHENTRRAGFGTGGRMLLGWHRGDLTMQNLIPFAIAWDDEAAKVIPFDSWSEAAASMRVKGS